MKHVNGGAEKVGSEVHVSADSFADQSSQVYGESTILHSTLLHTWTRSCRIFASQLKACSIGDSVIAESDLVNLMGRACTVDRVIASSKQGTVLRLSEVVAENCELYGDWVLEGNARISTGIWHRAPRFKRITGENGIDVGLTESTNESAMMACWRKPIRAWLKAGPRLGQKHSWTEKQINDARLFFTELLDVPLEGVRA